MKKKATKTKLPAAVKEELGELLPKLNVPINVGKLVNGILTSRERQELGLVDIDQDTMYWAKIESRKIVEVVARHRQLTPQRALLELARSLDLIGVGNYERLRAAIGERVVTQSHDVPEWNSGDGELKYQGRVVRTLSSTAIRPREILDHFHDDGWPLRIDSPFGSDIEGRKRREAVRSLNKGMTFIKFFCDGTGEGIIWQEV